MWTKSSCKSQGKFSWRGWFIVPNLRLRENLSALYHIHLSLAKTFLGKYSIALHSCIKSPQISIPGRILANFLGSFHWEVQVEILSSIGGNPEKVEEDTEVRPQSFTPSSPLHSPNRNPTTLAQTNCISLEIHSCMCLMEFSSQSFTTHPLPQPSPNLLKPQPQTHLSSFLGLSYLSYLTPYLSVQPRGLKI